MGDHLVLKLYYCTKKRIDGSTVQQYYRGQHHQTLCMGGTFQSVYVLAALLKKGHNSTFYNLIIHIALWQGNLYNQILNL